MTLFGINDQSLIIKKCVHMIVTCVRLELINYDGVAMDLPIEPNKPKGRPSKTVSALKRQPQKYREPKA